MFNENCEVEREHTGRIQIFLTIEIGNDSIFKISYYRYKVEYLVQWFSTGVPRLKLNGSAGLLANIDVNTPEIGNTMFSNLLTTMRFTNQSM